MNDWASKCARRIQGEWMVAISSSGVPPTHDAIVGVIRAYAQPLLDLLREAKRGHKQECPATRLTIAIDGVDTGAIFKEGGGACECGATEWNARIDKALE